jgi:MFS transporter, DHA1 family, multidrug resistance protein
MAEYIREAPMGQILRWVTNNRVLKYPEELPDWQCPSAYVPGADTQEEQEKEQQKEEEKEQEKDQEKEATEKAESAVVSPTPTEPLDKIPTASPDEDVDVEQQQPYLEGIRTRRTQIERVGTRSALQRSLTQKDLEEQFEQALAAETMPSTPIVPEKLEDGTILVDWYATDDPANPQNWTLQKKLFTTFQIW